MRNLILLVYIGLLFSCNGQNDVARNDSLFVDINFPHTNSLNRTLIKYPDTVQNKVIGKINFGINSKEFNQLYRPFLNTHKSDQQYIIGNFNFMFITPYFVDGKLYQADMDETFIRSDEAAKIDVDGAYNLIKAKYGKPDSVSKDVTDEDLFIWHIGRKLIRISKYSVTDFYQVDLVFTDMDLLKQVHTADQKHRDNIKHQQDELNRAAKKDI